MTQNYIEPMRPIDDTESMDEVLPSGFDPDGPEPPISRQLSLRREESLATSLPSGYAEDPEPEVLRQRCTREHLSLLASLPDRFYDENDKASPLQLIFLLNPVSRPG